MQRKDISPEVLRAIEQSFVGTPVMQTFLLGMAEGIGLATSGTVRFVIDSAHVEFEEPTSEQPDPVT